MHTTKCEFSRSIKKKCECSCNGYLHGSAYTDDINIFVRDE